MSTSGKASETFIPPHGGYAELLACQKALIVCQGTVRFCERFLAKQDRIIDQMVRAVRSGKQNIVEANQAPGTSKEAEMEDYRDFLRMRKIMLWAKDSKEALFVRRLAAKKNTSYKTYETYIETRSPEVVANILICLIHQTNYLLDQLLRKLEKSFVKDGGLRERMTRAQPAERVRQSNG